MGNHRFRLSNIIPNSWFYTNKLKTKLTKTQPITTSSSSSSSLCAFSSTQPATDQRKSYYFTRDLIVPDPIKTDHHQPDPKRKSTKKKRPTTAKKPIRRKPISPELTPTAGCTCRITPDSVSMESNSSNDDAFGKLDLAPIITKPVKRDEFGSGKWVIDGGSKSLTVKVVNDGGIIRSPGRKLKGSAYSPRLGNRVRVNGISGGRRSRRIEGRRSLMESMAVVKTSVDPGRDFKESMVEMIMENSIKSSKDLEELLACYLSLNSDEYHDLIIKVFKQIWFECTNVKL